MEPPVLPSQGGETSVVRVNECPRYSVYETNASNMAPDQFIPGIPLELPAPPMERESTPFLPPQSFIPPELAINPPTEKEKAILYRMHQELVYADMEYSEPEVNYNTQIITESSSQGSSSAAMNKSRTRSAPSFLHGSSSSSSSSKLPSTSSSSAARAPSTTIPSFSSSSTDGGSQTQDASSLDWATDEELLYETRRRRDNFLQARMRAAEQISTKYKKPNTLRRIKSSDSLRSIDAREGIPPTRCFAYGKGGVNDVRISPFSPSRLPLNQSLKDCSTPMNDSTSFTNERIQSISFQKWLELPTPPYFYQRHGLERPDWILTEPFSQSCQSTSTIPTPALNSSL